MKPIALKTLKDEIQYISRVLDTGYRGYLSLGFGCIEFALDNDCKGCAIADAGYPQCINTPLIDLINHWENEHYGYRRLHARCNDCKDWLYTYLLFLMLLLPDDIEPW